MFRNEALSHLLMDVDDSSIAPRASILVLYATQTGTAQEVAGDVARSLRKLLFSCRVCSIGDYQIVRLCGPLGSNSCFKAPLPILTGCPSTEATNPE